MSEEKQEVEKKVKRDEFGDVEEEETEVKRKTDLPTLFLPFLFVIFMLPKCS